MRRTQATVVEIARLQRWSTYHTRDSRGSDPGFPDLVLVRDRVVHVEMKRQGEKPKAAQVGWLDALARAGGEVYLWTIDDLDDVVAVLARRWSYDASSQRLSDHHLKDVGQEGEWWQPRTLWIPERGDVA